MKCPNCGAEIGKNRTCEFCGSRISIDMQREQELLNKKGCPKCGSSNVSFVREQAGEIVEEDSRRVIYKTVGICGDCGYTWTPEVDDSLKPPRRPTWLWVLGWIFIFPLPLTIILLRKKDMHPAARYVIMAAAWIIYLIFFFSGAKAGGRNSSGSGAPAPESGTVIEEQQPGAGNNEPVSEPQTGEPETEEPGSQAPEVQPEDPGTDIASEDPGTGETDPEGGAFDPSAESHEDADGDGISDDLKEFLDAFEAFVDVYCDFLKNYNSADSSKAAEYDELVEKYGEFMASATAWESFDMNAAERKYYMEVMSRISAKLLGMALTLE